MFQNKKRLVLVVVAVFFILLVALETSGFIMSRKNHFSWKNHLAAQKLDETALTTIETQNETLRKKISKNLINANFIVIDTAKNILYLKKGMEILKQAVVSCGSGNILEEPDGKRKWVFDTPRGEFKVLSKLRNPVWVKPDWAFIEEGENIPKKRTDRLEAGVLGDYAMGFGDGFFIHGTLYTRLLGRNVTHGCIRVGDEDLKAIYKAVSAGTKIYIF